MTRLTLEKTLKRSTCGVGIQPPTQRTIKLFSTTKRAFKWAHSREARTRGTGSLGCRAKRKIRSQQKLTYQLANRATNQPVRIPSASALDLLRVDVGCRKNLRRIVRKLTVTTFGAALSRPRIPISSLCRNSCSVSSLFPNRHAVPVWIKLISSSSGGRRDSRAIAGKL